MKQRTNFFCRCRSKSDCVFSSCTGVVFESIFARLLVHLDADSIDLFTHSRHAHTSSTASPSSVLLTLSSLTGRCGAGVTSPSQFFIYLSAFVHFDSCSFASSSVLLLIVRFFLCAKPSSSVSTLFLFVFSRMYSEHVFRLSIFRFRCLIFPTWIGRRTHPIFA